MSVIAFIPVRSGSKSIPLKNIKNFCGKPLIYWNLYELEKCKRVDKIVVATDSSEISILTHLAQLITKKVIIINPIILFIRLNNFEYKT